MELICLKILWGRGGSSSSITPLVVCSTILGHKFLLPRGYCLTCVFFVAGFCGGVGGFFLFFLFFFFCIQLCEASFRRSSSLKNGLSLELPSFS